MGRTSLCCFLYFLVLLYTTKTHTTEILEHSDLLSTEQKVLPMQSMSGAVRPWTGASGPLLMRPYHVLPMFEHVPVPLVDKQLFRPVHGRRRLPNGVSGLLVPRESPQHIHVSPARNTHGVEVWCGYNKISARVNMRLQGFRSSPASFYLGTCRASRSDKNFIYFHYDLNECDSSLTMTNNQIMYSNTLQYIPEPQETVIRAVPLTLTIQCLYNRFHYSYKMGFLPVIRERLLHKTFESKSKFTVSVCNERWDILEENQSFMLGEPVYFEVSAYHISKNERVFVDFCYASSSEEANSTPKHSIIHNFGCMEDSRRHGSLSRFHERQSNFIRFSVDAFLLPQVTGKHFYLHCLVSVHNTTTSASAKSCTYNSIAKRWEELYADASVCACCEATCEVKSTSSFVTQSLITSKSWILNKTEQSSTQHEEGWVSTQDDTKKVKSAQVIDEEEVEDYTEEIVTDSEEQMEPKEKKQEKLMRDADEEIEVITGTEATVTEFQEEVAVRSGKVMFLEEQMEKSVDTDAESVQSTIKTDTMQEDSAQLSDEPLKDVHNDTKANISVPKEETISREATQPDDLEKSMHVDNMTVQSHLVIHEDMFLNAKQEPMEWSQDAH